MQLDRNIRVSTKRKDSFTCIQFNNIHYINTATSLTFVKMNKRHVSNINQRIFRVPTKKRKLSGNKKRSYLLTTRCLHTWCLTKMDEKKLHKKTPEALRELNLRFHTLKESRYLLTIRCLTRLHLIIICIFTYQ